MKSLSQLKVAIVHDWLIGGGAERVVLELHRMFPDAPIYTSCATAEWQERLDGKVVTGFLQKWPLPTLRKFLPVLRIWWFTHLDLSGYDLVISSSGAEAKGVRAGKWQAEDRKWRKWLGRGLLRALRQDSSADNSELPITKPLHVNYCHSPTHYYWIRYDEYLKHPGFGRFDPLARIGLKLLVGPLRKWDFRAAQRPDIMIANSTRTQEMIKKYYKRDAVVVHPPVDVERFKSKKDELRHGFVIAGRQTPYKRIDLAVRACSELNVPLVVMGSGPEHRKLEKLAGRSVTFLHPTDEGVAEHFRTALALIFPGLDDFGITPVEAMAAGTPVIAFKAGGALDYVIENKTGTFFEKQTTKSLVKALQDFNPNRYKRTDLETKAAEFSPAIFQKNIRTVIDDFLAQTGP